MSREMEKLRARLEARHEELVKRLARTNETLRQPEDPDFEEQAADADDDEVLERWSHVGNEEIRRIRAALERMDQGTYGKCVSCGEKINPSRLQALPETATCIACAARA